MLKLCGHPTVCIFHLVSLNFITETIFSNRNACENIYEEKQNKYILNILNELILNILDEYILNILDAFEVV